MHTPAGSSACRAAVALHRLHSITLSPTHSGLSNDLHCEHVRPIPKKTCSHLFVKVCISGSALDMSGSALCMRLHTIRPQFHPWLVSVNGVSAILFYLSKALRGSGKFSTIC